MDRTGMDILSPLERDVTGLLAAGVADAEIGRRLGLTPAAVATILEQFVLWLGVRDRTQVAAWALEIGLRPGAGMRTRRNGMGSHQSRTLTEVERRVLGLSATGLTTVEVADRLGLGPDEVRRTVRDACVALGARSKLEAVVLALRLGLIDLSPR